jgi:hypothetical protein
MLTVSFDYKHGYEQNERNKVLHTLSQLLELS